MIIVKSLTNLKRIFHNTSPLSFIWTIEWNKRRFLQSIGKIFLKIIFVLCAKQNKKCWIVVFVKVLNSFCWSAEYVLNIIIDDKIYVLNNNSAE
jgi:hypothetical protein